MKAHPRTGDKPLAGRRVVVTRAPEQAVELAEQLTRLGAEPLICPAIQIDPPDSYEKLDAAIDRLDEYDWLLITSANGVTALLDRMRSRGRGLPANMPKVAVVGAATARIAQAHGLAVKTLPERYVAESLQDTFGDLSGQTVLLIRADVARPMMIDSLRKRGAMVEDVVAYRTVPGHGLAQLGEALRSGEVDAVTFSSSSTVRYFVDGLRASGNAKVWSEGVTRAAVICLGPVTASAARASGLPVDVIANTFDAAGLTDALIEWFNRPEATG